MPPVPHGAGVLWGTERSKRFPDQEMVDLFAKIVQRDFTLGNSVIGPLIPRNVKQKRTV